MIGDLEVVTIGLSHRTAPVELREKFAVASDELAATFEALRESRITEEMVILSTCNRVEFYALVRADDGGQGIMDYLASTRGVRTRKLRKHSYQFQGEDAVKHIFRVAASLDSMVVGEPQILGQFKDAFAAADQHRAVGGVLRRLMRRTLTVAKRIRTETRIGQTPVSMGRAGVELARQVFGDLDGRAALMIGAGEMGRLVATSLMAHGVDELVVANRTYSKAVELAERFSGTAVRMDQVQRYLERVDIVLASTGAARYLVDRAMLAPVMRTRRFRPLFCVDLAVPRNIAPDVNALEGVYAFNVDDLAEVARRGAERRRAEASRAAAIIEREAERCYRSLGARSADPVIAGMTRRAEEVRQIELERSRATLEALDPKHREVVEAMTRSMFKRYLHNAILEARRLGEQGDSDGLEVIARGLGDPIDLKESK